MGTEGGRYPGLGTCPCTARTARAAFSRTKRAFWVRGWAFCRGEEMGPGYTETERRLHVGVRVVVSVAWCVREPVGVPEGEGLGEHDRDPDRGVRDRDRE